MAEENSMEDKKVEREPDSGVHPDSPVSMSFDLSTYSPPLDQSVEGATDAHRPIAIDTSSSQSHGAELVFANINGQMYKAPSALAGPLSFVEPPMSGARDNQPKDTLTDFQSPALEEGTKYTTRMLRPLLTSHEKEDDNVATKKRIESNSDSESLNEDSAGSSTQCSESEHFQDEAENKSKDRITQAVQSNNNAEQATSKENECFSQGAIMEHASQNNRDISQELNKAVETDATEMTTQEVLQMLDQVNINDSDQNEPPPDNSPSSPQLMDIDDVQPASSVIAQDSDQNEAQKDEHVRILQFLQNSERTVNVQYLQLCFAGPPLVGKTTVRNRLLNLECPGIEPQNMKVATYDQTLTFLKKGKWRSYRGVQKKAQAVFSFLKESVKVPGSQLATVNCQGAKPHYEVTSIEESEGKSQLQAAIDFLKEITRCGDISMFENLIDSILLNVHDFGGNACFLEMLPALLHGPALYLLCFKMSEPVRLIEASMLKILSSIASIQCMSSEPTSLPIQRIPEFSEMFREFKKICPTVVLVGTHSDKVKQNNDSSVNEALSSTAELFEKDIHIVYTPKKSFFPVDESNSGDSLNQIRDLISNYFTKRFSHVALPIQPNWLLFGIILRREYHIITMSDCLEIGKVLKMSEDEIKVCLWYLHYCVGTLIYFPDIPDKWFKEHVICSPQVVFNSIEKLLLCVLHSDRVFCTSQDTRNWNEGQFSIERINRSLNAQFHESLRDIKDKKLIPVPSLIELLKYVHLLSPVEPKGTFFMPAILDIVQQNELTSPPSVDSKNPEPLFIKFKCGYIPTGVFCQLITRLVSSNEHFGLKWKLNRKQKVKQNYVSFYINNVNLVTFLCHEKCYEIRLTWNQVSITLHDLCTHVLSVVLYILNSIVIGTHSRNIISPVIAFQCHCPVHKDTGGYHYLNHCIPTWSIFGVQYLCDDKEVSLNRSQTIWLGKHVSLGDEEHLEVLKYSTCREDFSFKWMKKGSESITCKVEGNKLIFKKINKQDLGFYQCEVTKKAKLLFTVYLGLFETASIDPSKDSPRIAPRETVDYPARSLQLVELCKRFELSDEQVNREISDKHILEIYSQLDKWEEVANHLGLTKADIEAVKSHADRAVGLMRLYALQDWKKKAKVKRLATYGVLLEALLKCDCSCTTIQLYTLLENATSEKHT